jgi:transposase
VRLPRADASHDGIGTPLAPTILAELGDARRFADGDAVVRHTGLDVTVSSSHRKRSPGPRLPGAALGVRAEQTTETAKPEKDHKPR